ncbi:hypothetical protein ACFLZW_05600 [Chloroflexota bacterium]
MNKRISLYFGIGLILIGGLLLTGSLFRPLVSFYARLWPLFIIAAGVLFMAAPILAHKRGLGALFIPGALILANGGILFFTSITGWWEAWSILWPLEILALAAGFLLAALYMRSIWMTLPAVLIGLNGLVLMFCAVTGWWQAWALLWTVEPLAIGIMLLIAASRSRSRATFITGLIFCVFAGASFLGMGAIMLADWRMLRLAGPISVIAAGLALLFWGITRSQRGLTPASDV